MTSVFVDVTVVRVTVESLTMRATLRVPRPVVPLSVSFTPPPAAPSRKIVVDDLGVPGDRRRQNDAPRFWSGERQ